MAGSEKSENKNRVLGLDIHWNFKENECFLCHKQKYV